MDALREAGYDVDLVEVEGANHSTVIFHDLVDDEVLTLADSPAGTEVVQTIVDAIDDATHP